MKKILGLDLGTNSIGWALIDHDFQKKSGEIKALGSRIIPMSQDILGKFDSGVSISQTAERTGYRSVRRLYQRDNLRRERLHRVLNILGFLPNHYRDAIDFETKLGQFKEGLEIKLNYRLESDGKYKFIFMHSFLEMVKDFEGRGARITVPYDWTIYYLRKKALSAKISKEELAWLILNFNQKRGYYQLRGEDEELPGDKKKEFVILDVEQVVETGDEIKKTGEKLYEVHFKNGWIYDKPIVKTENWTGKSKEFIVTTTTKSNGEVKRTYKAVNSEEDWLAIKSKTEQTIDNSGQTVGEFIYQNLLDNPNQKLRGKLVKTIERKYYKEEFKLILKKQIGFHPELQSSKLYLNCLNELYPRNESHQKSLSNKGFDYLILEDIIFYQRPLKSKKSTIATCQYESRTFVKWNKETESNELIKEPIKVISKSNPIFQEFRLWQFIRNLRIYKNEKKEGNKIILDIDVTTELLKNEDDWTDLYDFLNNRREIDQNQILKYFSDQKLIAKQLKDKAEYRWNYVEDKKYPCNETRASFLARLDKVEGLSSKDFLTEKVEGQLWHIIYSVKDKREYEAALNTFASKYQINKSSFIENFKHFPPFKADYGSYSEKAIKKLLPLMRVGKYFQEEAIPVKVKQRVASIMERLREVDFNTELIKQVTDDDIPLKLLKSFIPFQNKTGLSGLNTYQACYAVYDRHSEVTEIKHWKTPADIDMFLKTFRQHSLRNPIVEQVVMETLRVVRDIWQVYGNAKPNFFSEIHLELGREMRNSADKRKKISQRNLENENTNFRIKAILAELKEDDNADGDIRPFSPSHQEILKIYEEGVSQNPAVSYSKLSELEIEKIRKTASPTKSEIVKYKLWLEQGYISPYTGKVIPLSKLFTSAYEVEHIIPQSRYFDDSLGNKVICESAVNTLKNNQTAYEFISMHGTEKVDVGGGRVVTVLALKDYQENCNQYFQKNRTKLKNLLSEDIPEGFINRQLNDSRYISKLIKGLLSNIVREKNEQEVTSKNLIPVTGAITAKLKQDWGLNDKWNELVAPRFQRMNSLTNSSAYGFMDKHMANGVKTGGEFFRTQVPDDISRGFTKKRIDHRHHALDALIIAATALNHVQYLNALNAEKHDNKLRGSLLVINEHGHFTKRFQSPWSTFTKDAQKKLELVVISFKQNNRIINKTNNKTWQWRTIKGQLKKVLVKQTKGDNWAIRKPMHKDTVSGKIQHEAAKGKIVTATRVSIADIKTEKHLAKITDPNIQCILRNHLIKYAVAGSKQYEEAFSPEGIEELNKNITYLNNGKYHQPIFKVRLFETGTKFPVGQSGNKSTKYVEAAKGTNLFFAIYHNAKSGRRSFETVPLNEVVEHQKQVAHLPKTERVPIPIDKNKGQFIFSLSPNDLVFVPNEDEQENPTAIDFSNLSKNQVERVYKMVSCTGLKCHFVQDKIASLIKYYDAKSGIGELGSLNKSELSFENKRIKEICWKLEVDRLGNIKKVIY